MKRTPRQDAVAGEAARLGSELREARMALGWSVEDVAARLRIRRIYLAALEDGQVRDLPSPAYAIGFVRNYASALGLDADAVVQRFRDAIQGAPLRRTDLVFPEPVPERGFPAGVIVAAGAVVAVASYALWYAWSGAGNRSVDTVAPVPPALEQTARLPDAPRVTPPPNPGPPPGPPNAAPTAGSGPSAPQAPTAPMAAAGPATEAPAAAPSPPAGGEQPRILLRFTADSWTQVRDPRTGQTLVNRIMRSGETFAVPPDRQGLLLSTGNAQGMQILVEGQPATFMTGLAGVRRDIPLDVERLRQPAPPAPRPAAPRPAPPPAPQ